MRTDRAFPIIGVVLFTLALLPPHAAEAAWPSDSTVNLPVCTATNSQQKTAIVSDGTGGVIVAWQDCRSGSDSDIYAQRISAAGVAQWAANGVALCSAAEGQFHPQLISDGAGGAIVTWQDERSSTDDIYAQRVSADGVALWTADGVPLCTATGSQWLPVIVPDGAGGAVVAWWDARTGGWDVYAQRISAAGDVQWTADGVAVSVAAGGQEYVAIASDGAGGAIMTWRDSRGSPPDIYAQRVSAAGVAQWTADGVPICTAMDNQDSPAILSDGAAGAIIAWQDARGGFGYDIYAQRVSAAGVAQWTADGVALCTATDWQYSPMIASDGAGGGIVTWPDLRSGTSDIYAQRVSAAGAVQWTADGVALCSSPYGKYYPVIVSDGLGGAFVAWEDQRSGGAYPDIYAQRVSTAGVLQWNAGGVGICTATERQAEPAIAAISGTPGGVAYAAVVAWTDVRSGTSDDVYAQQVLSSGRLGGDPAPVIESVGDVPMDQGGKVLVLWAASWLDAAPDYEIGEYTLWRRVTTMAAEAALARGATLMREALTRSRAPREGTIRVRTEGATATYWEYIASIPARGVSGYGYTAATTADSTAGYLPYNVFFVDAQETGSSTFYVSDPDSGYSVDNLSPVMPALFTGEYAGGTATLHWAVSVESDFAQYRLHRGKTPGFVPDAANLVVAQSDTGYVDAIGSPHYYKLCAADVHGNLSPFATLLPAGASGVPGGPAAAFALEGAAPNPSRGERLSVAFALPVAGPARLELMDVSGRRVVEREVGTLGAGRHVVDLAAGRRLTPGLYLLRLTQGTQSRTMRVAVLK